MSCIEYEVLTVLNVEIAASCVEPHCSLMGMCEYFGGTAVSVTIVISVHCSEYGSIIFLWNIVTHDIISQKDVILCTRSPSVPNMPRCAQSGRRTFGIWVGFIESYIVVTV